MITYKLNILGGQEAAQRLRDAGKAVRGAALKALDAWAKETASYVIDVKLSDGNPLNRRSGKLSRSVHGFSSSAGDKVSGVVGGGAGVPYARIQEYGGDIYPKAAKALRFRIGGKLIFSKHVRIPERSYLRSSLKERAPEGIAELKAATLGVFG